MIFQKAISLLLLTCLTFSGQAWAQYGNFSDDDLETLLAPIALYPDPLIAQILPAATYVDQIDEAQRVLRGRVDEDLIDRQDWDVSVKAIAHYPTVLRKLDADLNWTASLGQAYINQPGDVMDAIQRLRGQARAAGHLLNNAQQEIIYDGAIIRIVPAQAEYIYVPVYDPEVVYLSGGPYGEEYFAAGIISFGLGFAIGAWLNYDCDWHHRHVYYHGWQGGGWIAHSRPRVHITNMYVNDNYTNVIVNRNIMHRNVDAYRNTRLRQNVETRRADINRGAPAPRVEPGRTRPNYTGPVHRNVNVDDRRLENYRGRAPQPEARPAPQAARPVPQVAQPAPQAARPVPQVAQPAPQATRPVPQVAQPAPPSARPAPAPRPSVFQDYKNNRDVQVERARGQASRQAAQPRPAPQPAPRAAPAVRPPAGRPPAPHVGTRKP
jgi:hypothetical protein